MLLEFKTSRFDKAIFLCILVFSLFSLLAVYSATSSSHLEQVRDNFHKQVIWILLGLVLYLIVSHIPMRFIYSLSYTAYGVLVILLIFLEIFDTKSGGAQRWFVLGDIMIQPSEFMKPVLVLTLARYLSEEHHSPNKLRHLGMAFIIVLVPFALVIKQPDLGTSLVLLSVLIPMLYWRNLSPFIIFVLCAPFVSFVASFNFWTFFIVILLISAILVISRRSRIIGWSVFIVNIMVGLLAPFLWGKLHGYQQQRILNFLGLVSDPHGVGYQIIQSKVAIGSGGLLGKGLLQGSQTQLRFLPAQHTDFIFSVIAEEWGFIGSILLLAAFYLFLWRGVKIASATEHGFASLVAIGLVTIFSFQIIVNVGMTIGIMPVTGVPLPFISYGGSAMLTNMAMAGLILNTAMIKHL